MAFGVCQDLTGGEALASYRSLYLHGTVARLLSTRGRSTSELLRTLQMNGCFQANILAVSAIPPRYGLQLSPYLGALAGGLSCSSFGRGP